MNPEELIAALGPALSRWAEMIEDAQRFRWLMMQNNKDVNECWTCAMDRMEGWCGSADLFEAACSTEIRAEIDKRRGAR